MQPTSTYNPQGSQEEPGQVLHIELIYIIWLLGNTLFRTLSNVTLLRTSCCIWTFKEDGH